jgi:hypothetical protein
VPVWLTTTNWALAAMGTTVKAIAHKRAGLMAGFMVFSLDDLMRRVNAIHFQGRQTMRCLG